MCTYCMLADHAFRFDPPWNPQRLGNPYHPNIPQPLQPNILEAAGQIPSQNPGWSANRLKEFQKLLTRIKTLEDRLGCECDEPEKPDYIKLVEQRIKQLEDKVNTKSST